MRERSGPRAAAAVRWIMLISGAAGLLGGTLQFGAVALRPTAMVANPVFGNVRRLPYEETMVHHVGAYGANVAMIAAWVLTLVAATYAFALLLRAFHRPAPPATLAAAVFLSAGIVAGVLIGTSLLKVSEFAVQAATAAPAEQEWLTAGINWLTQLHIVYVSAWMLATGVGWLFLAAAAGAAAPDQRSAAVLLRAGGAALVASMAARALLPLAGPSAPAVLVALGEPLAALGFGLGFWSCGRLVGMVERERRANEGTVLSPSALPR